VLIADDHALFRDGVASLLRAWGMEVVGQASDGLQALEIARTYRPDLILMDINMPNCSGLEATRLIKTEMPEAMIVMVTVSVEEEHLFEAIKSGAVGYILKDTAGEEFGRLLKSIAEGEAPLSTGMASKILAEFARQDDDSSADEGPDSDLTEREREVLELVVSGATNKEIGASLHISDNTVSYHMKNILSKLHLRNRAEAVAYALRTGLVSQDPLE
jgi:DNA-binding NarL/FixJ family response regulator